MYSTHKLKPLSVQRTIKQSKSLSNFILLNKNRQQMPISQRKHEWKPLQTTQRIMRLTNSINKQISFGGSYSNKKSILVTLNKQMSPEKKNVNAVTEQQLQKAGLLSKQQQTERILRTKLALTQRQTPIILKSSNNRMSTLKNNSKTFGFLSQSNKQKIEQKFNKFTNTTTEFNKKVEDNLTEVKRVNSFRLRESGRKLSQRKEETQVHKSKNNTNLESKRMIGIITVTRYGLRIRLKHIITKLCTCTKSSHQQHHSFQYNNKVTSLVTQMFSLPSQVQKTFYYFRLNKQPISSVNDLPLNQCVVLAFMSPVFNVVESENYVGLCEEVGRLEAYVRELAEAEVSDQQLKEDDDDQEDEQSLRATQKSSKKTFTYISSKKRSKFNNNNDQQQNQDEQETKYDWQLIPDIHEYIQKVVQNPEIIRQQFQIKSGISHNPSIKNKILQLYKQKFDTVTKTETGENFRNPLLEDHSHYHVEVKEKKLLSSISDHLNQYDFINNMHMARRQSIDQLNQQAKQQKLFQLHQQTNPNITNRNIQHTLNSKKSLIKQLDQKNSLLFQQNIPYMMNKYGINRYEIHNLFTIYKTLQKISGMKEFDKNSKINSHNKNGKVNSNGVKKVLSKGIDRGTFDEGMKRLDINPGDEVIKNICYFDDFISWQQFIKIVSIGLRKTPQQKLQAILSGIGGTSHGQLNKKQISIMIGNSLTKIFDSDQVELKEYFTNVAMRDLDADGSGTVDINEIKKKCLYVADKKGDGSENMDLVTFLLLNS